jgi:hypothetical protein
VRNVTNKRAAVIGIAAPLILALVLLMVAPAAAHHKSGHSNGGGNGKSQAGSSSGGSGSGVTEDNDSNDNDTPNNVVDNDDNAHPSGKDKSVEHGNSGNQGNSTSDPDDDGRGPDRSNGGADKPDGPGGVDLADQDGNNGCGNDDDFEDDNEGWCGKNPKRGGPDKEVGDGKVDKPEKSDDKDDEETVVKDRRIDKGRKSPCPEKTTMVGSVCELVSDAVVRRVKVEDGVLGERIERPAAAEVAVLPANDTAVAAEQAERSPAALPFTGSGVVKLLLVALVLLVAGFVMLKARRRV